MGLFNKKLRKEKTKEIYEYKILEEYNIDLNENSDLVKRMGETDKYIFYLYKPKDNIFRSEYLLRQSKSNIKNIVYFGSKPTYACLFEGYIFCANKTGEMNRHDYIKAINVENGTNLIFKWLGKNGKMVFINGYGRAYNQDIINNMSVEDNKLIINVQREKGTVNDITDRNYDMDYTIEVEYKNDSFIPTYYYGEEIKVSTIYEEKNMDSIKNTPNNEMLVQKRPETVSEEKKCFCPHCGYQIEKEWNYCYNCGKQIKNDSSEIKEKNNIEEFDKTDMIKLDNVCCFVFNNSMNTINNINQIMANYGAKLLIEKNKETFVMNTYLVCLYFYNINLQKNNIFNNNIRNKMYETLINEMSQRTNIDFEIAQKDYLAIRDLLDKISSNEFGDTNPLMKASVAYLEIAFAGKYDSKKLDNESFGDLLLKIATEFKNIINNSFN